MLKREELVKIIEEYRLSHIQSEAEVSSKLIVPLIEWLGYPSQYRAQEFPVYGYDTGTALRAKSADYVLFDDDDFANHRFSTQKHINWVYNHSLIIIEAKKPGKAPETNTQPQFYSAWTRAIAYLIIDGIRIKGYLYRKNTADTPIIDCDISALVDNEDFLLFSYENTLSIKKNGTDSPVSIQYKRKLSSMNGDSIPDSGDMALIPRYIIPADPSACDHSIDDKLLPIERLKQEKCVILLADAGYGKTYTLYQIYHEAEHQGYHPFFYHLRSLPEESALVLLAQDKIDVDEKAVFILDGFDEMSETKRARLNKIIDGIIAHNPEILIILSSRTIAYSGQTDKKKLFAIKPITKQDIDAFIFQCGIDVMLWNQQATERGLEQFCANPFYLWELVNIWQSEKSLPNRSDLMKEIVDSRIKEDIARIRDQSIILHQRLSETKKAFERIALVMQCIQRYSLTQDELNRLYDRGFQQIMSCHGLWIMTEDGSWNFAHNNFREYFAAVALSHMNLEQIKRFITEDSNCEYIRPSWYNVLSYLVTAYRKPDLQNWLYEIQPTLIILFEKDRLDDGILTNAIKRIMNINKERGTWVDRNYSTFREVASFCSTPEAVQYIIDELQLEQTTRHKQNLLRCLAEFNSFYHLEDTVKDVVSDIAFDKTEEIQVRDDAFIAMRNHPVVFMEDIEKAAHICMEETDESIIYAILSFIQKAGKAEQYIDAVIDAFDKYDLRKSKNISYKMIIDRIFREIQGLDAANKVLTYLVDHKKKLHEERNSELFILCCNVGMRYYDDETNCFLQTLLCLFNEYDALLSLNIYAALANYIAHTHTESIFVNHIILRQPIRHCGFILSRLISDPMIDDIIKMIANKTIDLQIVKDLIFYLPYSDSKQAKLMQSVFIYTNDIIQIDPPKDYAGERDAEHQKFFDSLFNENLFDALVKELLKVLGNEAQMCEESINALIEKGELQPNGALIDCYFALQEYIPNNKGIFIKDYKNYISDWNEFCFIFAENSIETNQTQVSAEQRDYLEGFCIRYFDSTDIEAEIKVKENEISTPPLLSSSARIFRKLAVRVSEELAIKLLIVPSTFFDHDYYDQLPECVVTQISPEKLRECIVELIHAGKWNQFTANEYIRYCLEYHITECKEDIKQYVLDRRINGGLPYWALEYLEKEFGIDVILTEILPACNDDDLLSNLAERIPENIFSSVLDNKLWDAYHSHQNMKWLTNLIKRNNKDALLEYYRQAFNLMTLPDMVLEPMVPETTEAIRNIDSPECISVLVDLLKLSYNPRFKDRKYFGLKYSCTNAITAIGKIDYAKTHDTLSAAITEDKTPSDKAILDMIHAIEAERQFTLDKPMEFEIAVQIVPQ